MYRGYKIVVNTAAGRRRYMQYLVPFILSSDIVDRYDIWINTHNGADIEFFKRIAKKYPQVNLCWQPDGIVDGISSINAFYKSCIEEDAIYFKLDDDIVWMEPDAIKKMVDFRIDNPQYFLVTPLVINNSLSTYLLQVRNKIILKEYCNSYSGHYILWESGTFASDLHKWFINHYLNNGEYKKLYLGKQEMGMTRFSINSILWFGKEMKKINGIIPGDDEEFLSCIYPTMYNLSNCWNGDAIMSHFAFFTQREKLDAEGILDMYGNYISNIKDEKFSRIYNEIQYELKCINDNLKLYENQPSPYSKPKLKKEKGVKRILNKIFPKKFLNMVILIYSAYIKIYNPDKLSKEYIIK